MTQAFSFLLAAIAMALAWLIYSRIPLLRRWFIPPALIGGLILFLSGPELGKIWGGPERDFIYSWPPLLLGYLFAAIVLGFESGDRRGLVRPVIQQNLFVWFLCFGQLFGSFILYLIFFRGQVSPLISHIVEIGWAGGPGSAAAMSAVMRRLSQPAIGDLGLFSATLGQIWGAVSGIWIVNLLNRRRQETDGAGATNTSAQSQSKGSARTDASIEQTVHADSLAEATLRFKLPERKAAVRVFLLFLLPLSAVFIAIGAKQLLGAAARALPDIRFLGDIPLFSLALMCAFPVRWLANGSGILTRENCETIQNINGQVLDWIILAAMATVQPSAFIGLLAPFLVLMAWGIFSCFLLFFYFAPRMLPQGNWRELGLITYGMATGTTALGLMLLGLLHSKRKDESRLVYGMAVPFNAPFIGGGIVSLTLPEWTARGGEIIIPVLLAVSMILMYFICVRMNRKSTGAHDA